jgi:hypothetical protein
LDQVILNHRCTIAAGTTNRRTIAVGTRTTAKFRHFMLERQCPIPGGRWIRNRFEYLTCQQNDYGAISDSHDPIDRLEMCVNGMRRPVHSRSNLFSGASLHQVHHYLPADRTSIQQVAQGNDLSGGPGQTRHIVSLEVATVIKIKGTG